MNERADPRAVAYTRDELDQVVKSLMKSVTANTEKLRRLKDGSPQYRQAVLDGDALADALTKTMAVQRS